MMRSLTLAALGTFFLTAQAQKQPYEDLLVKYVDEKYEDCLAKALNYTEKDDTKKDPLPYLYMSMCLYEMSKIDKYRAMEEYKKSDRDAVKYAEKYRKKDKNKEFFDNYADFWSELNTMAQDAGITSYEDGQYSKSKQWFDGMVGYYPENPGAHLMLGLSLVKSNMLKEGEAEIAKYQPAVDGAGGIGMLPDDQKKLMKHALINYAAYLDSKGNRSKAKEVLEPAKEFFTEDAEFKGAYESY